MFDERLQQLVDDFDSADKNNLHFNLKVLAHSQLFAEFDGDWKHDHLYFRSLIENHCAKYGFDVEFEEHEKPSEDDWYTASYYIYLTEADKPFYAVYYKNEGGWSPIETTHDREDAIRTYRAFHHPEIGHECRMDFIFGRKDLAIGVEAKGE